ncbi:DEAD/DEAH box helicase [Pirellulaceae bacterium SH501]
MSTPIEEMTDVAAPLNGFLTLGLPEPICDDLASAGYHTPTPIQAATIPSLLTGQDVLGQAQTGTGKTAAFALPLLCRIDVNDSSPQVLVLAPTRELAIQVAESFERYGKSMRGLHVACLYGGSGYAQQIQALRQRPQIIVGTPGRVMDHMREERLKIDKLRCLVLDEADEMLRMGFVDDVRWVLTQAPQDVQIALFSATMPPAIREIADKHLKEPHVVSIANKQKTADTIRQRYLMIEPKYKLDVLQRVLENEPSDGTIIFVKTRNATVEIAEALNRMGYTAVAINGEIAQAQRERTIEQLKDGTVQILVATDVAARGLDVQRITHVINYDLPFDTEAYIHRIGRTGRAGREGEAILFITPRQRGFLKDIHRAIGKAIDPMEIPTVREINQTRIARLKSKIAAQVEKDQQNSSTADLFKKWITECCEEHQFTVEQAATALAKLCTGERPFLMPEEDSLDRALRGRDRRDRDDRGPRDDRDGFSRGKARTPRFDPREHRDEFSGREGDGPRDESPRAGMDLFRVEVGRQHGVRPGNLVGAIANEIELDSSYIGQITIFDEHSTVYLPKGMPRELFKILGRAWVVGRQLRISKLSDRQRVRSR